jgi:hypothetical protein
VVEPGYLVGSVHVAFRLFGEETAPRSMALPRRELFAACDEFLQGEFANGFQHQVAWLMLGSANLAQETVLDEGGDPFDRVE